MKKWLVLSALVLVVVLAFPVWLPGIGTFLLVPDRVEKADAIVLLRGGDDFFRLPKAIDLLEHEYAPHMIIAPAPERENELQDYYQFRSRLLGTDTPDSREMTRRALEYFGKDLTNVTILEDETTSTYDEAAAAKKWLIEHDARSFILVGATYHMRRAMIIFSLVFRGTGIRIYPVTAQFPLYNPPYWWRREKDVKRVLEEYVSITFNLLYHFVLKKHRTEFDTF